MKEKATIVDVAERAGVSTSMVSVVMNRKGGAPQTRKKILEAARSLGYRPNHFASGMRSTVKNCFGILISKISEGDPWLEKLLPIMVSSVTQCGYRCSVDFWRGPEGDLPPLLDAVDGCILLGRYSHDFFHRVKESYGLPLVTYSEKMPYPNGIRLQVDWGAAMNAIVQYLLAHQHQNIGLVIVGTGSPSLQERYDAFYRSMEHFGKKVDDSAVSTASWASVYDEEKTISNLQKTSAALTSELLERHPELTAVIYGSDITAFAGMEALRAAGRRLPDDMSVVSCGNTDWCQVMTPQLTSAGLDHNELSMLLVESLESLIGERKRAPAGKLVPKLNVRESVVTRIA